MSVPQSHFSLLDCSDMASQVGDVLFDRRDIIGWGPTGTVVLRGTWGQEPVAVKRFLTAPLKILDVHQLVKCDHVNILKLHDVITLKGFTYFTLELCSCNLNDYLAGKGADFSNRAILQQTAQGLSYLHSLGVIHRGLKPTNVLLCLPTDRSPQVTVKLSDFGTTSKWSNDTWPGCDPDSSEGWLSPEQIKAGVHDVTSAADIFLLGCIFYVTLTGGQHPFGSLPYFRNQKILAGQQDLSALLADRDIAPVASGLIEWMIQRQPEQRPSIERVLSHPDFWLEE